jgi:hypothetical protein
MSDEAGLRPRLVAKCGTHLGIQGGIAREAMQSIEPPVRFGLVYVDDGSTTARGAILRKLAERDGHCRIVGLPQLRPQIAITSRIDAAAGTTYESHITLSHSNVTYLVVSKCGDVFGQPIFSTRLARSSV